MHEYYVLPMNMWFSGVKEALFRCYFDISNPPVAFLLKMSSTYTEYYWPERKFLNVTYSSLAYLKSFNDIDDSSRPLNPIQPLLPIGVIAFFLKWQGFGIPLFFINIIKWFEFKRNSRSDNVDWWYFSFFKSAKDSLQCSLYKFEHSGQAHSNVLSTRQFQEPHLFTKELNTKFT